MLDSYKSRALQNKEFKRPKKEEVEVNIYVNCSTGNDKHNYGTTPEKPFKTISYAVNRIPYMRDSADYAAIINIAQGTYNESVSIYYDNVSLLGEGSSNTRIVGPGDWSTIHVEDSDAFHLSGLEITDGFLAGIWIYKSNARGLSDITVHDSLFGIVVIDNSYASFSGDITTSENFGGILIADSSNADFSGNVYATFNSWNGIVIDTKSYAVFSGDVTSSVNSGGGIGIGESSNALFSGNAFVISNKWNGVFIDNGSLIVSNIFGGTVFLVEDNGFNGINLTKGASITNQFDNFFTIRDNYWFGLNVDNGSSINFNGGNTITGNRWGVDISLSFGSRGTFNGADDIGTINCDGTVLIRGNQTCPEI